MKNAVYWIALQSALGYGCRQVSQIIETFENVEELFDKNLIRSTFHSFNSFNGIILKIFLM